MEATVTTFAQKVAGNLRAEMARRELGLEDLANALEVSIPTARSRFQGSKSLSIGEVGTISERMGIPLRSLIPDGAAEVAA